jgi:dipeptidyl aminopeptidase/acylaminoacyl peptidase
MRARALALAGALAALASGCGSSQAEPPRAGGGDAQVAAARPEPEAGPAPFRRLPGITTGRAFGDLGAEGLDRWRRDVPQARDVRVTSTRDGSRQPALWLAPSRPGPQPLLVVLHSWSNGYRQHLGIPYARWAQRQGWAVVAPHFRGANVRAQAMGSDLAVQDVLDAVADAGRRADIDGRRVYVVGFSGGGMMALLLAGRHPERFGGVAAWVPVVDLVDWHAYNASFTPPRGYAIHMERACGGDPRYLARARASCRRRSPATYLARARRAGVPVFLGHGLSDTLVTPDAALRAFNAVARRDDRIGARSVRRVASGVLPEHLRGEQAESHFDRRDPDVLFARRSGPVTVVLFDGEHDLVFHPALRWMARLASPGAPRARG